MVKQIGHQKYQLSTLFYAISSPRIDVKLGAGQIGNEMFDRGLDGARGCQFYIKRRSGCSRNRAVPVGFFRNSRSVGRD
jgi:hypothetical protein